MNDTVIYIAGPISGNPNYRQLFAEAESRLQYEGQVILNPARLLEGLEDEKCLPICLQMIELADSVMMLPGWRKSLGAFTEALYALRQGKIVCSWDMARRKIKRLAWDSELGIVEATHDQSM